MFDGVSSSIHRTLNHKLDGIKGLGPQYLDIYLDIRTPYVWHKRRKAGDAGDGIRREPPESRPILGIPAWLTLILCLN